MEKKKNINTKDTMDSKKKYNKSMVKVTQKKMIETIKM